MIVARALLAFAVLPAIMVAVSSAEAVVPAFADAAGDANLANGQGLAPVPDDGPDTRPASVAGADLVSGSYATTYRPTPQHEADGRLVAVRHVADGLRLTMRTSGTVEPTFGPTIAFEWGLRMGGCDLVVRAYAHGPLSRTDDPRGAEVRTSSACPGGAGVHRDRVAMRIDGASLRVDMGFEGLDFLTGGAQLTGAGARTAVVQRIPAGDALAAPVIDLAPPSVPFVVGVDVPPDVDCGAEPGHDECIAALADHDTGEDLHATLLGSGPSARAGGDLNVGREYGVYSFRPDGGWLSFGLDVSRIDAPWIEVNLASRLMRAGAVHDEWLPFADAFAEWKLYSGSDDDPYRNVITMVNDTPYGFVASIANTDVDRVTILGGSRVDANADVGMIVGLRGSNEGFFGEPFPDAYGEWVASWTAGLDKVRLIPDHRGVGMDMALWMTSTVSDARRNVAATDDRVGTSGVTGPGAFRMTAELEAEGPAFATTLVSYGALGVEGFEFTWGTPAGNRKASGRVEGSRTFWARATETEGGPGDYSFELALDTVAEAGNGVTFVHDVWNFDPASVLPGLDPSFASDPAEDGPALLSPGERRPGPTPALVIGSVSARRTG